MFFPNKLLEETNGTQKQTIEPEAKLKTLIKTMKCTTKSDPKKCLDRGPESTRLTAKEKRKPLTGCDDLGNKQTIDHLSGR